MILELALAYALRVMRLYITIERSKKVSSSSSPGILQNRLASFMDICQLVSEFNTWTWMPQNFTKILHDSLELISGR
jgi:hypothetical protein